MRVVGGRHLGLKGKVVGKLGGKEEEEEEERSRGLRVVLKLLSSGEEVTAGGDEVAELGSLEEEMCLKKLEELKNGDSKEKEKSRSSSRDDGDRRKDSRKEDNKRKREERRSVDENGTSEKGKWNTQG
ncbi:hypothetical protein Syun_020040 [Stephania yunnanensis]|uniref:Uncharacterized protein n=1 Tax=Stephania yunnanensis TaxID=152371 RepID=A0AAP0NX78_9MAGN